MQGEVVKREGQKKDIPGWNFCKWMAGMECVANTFEGVGLYSDALAQYEEIDAAFMQCLQERNLPFFSHVGGSTPGDDSAPLLDVTTKDYRDLILRNEITLFDFRSYVFAKRATLLGKLGRVSQVMRETPIFLIRVGTMLQGEVSLVQLGDISRTYSERALISAVTASPFPRELDFLMLAGCSRAVSGLAGGERRR